MAAKKIRKMGKTKEKPFAKKGEQKTIKCPKCGATISRRERVPYSWV